MAIVFCTSLGFGLFLELPEEKYLSTWMQVGP
jgi:hypothetical protein